jgi:hypothetical protein
MLVIWRRYILNIPRLDPVEKPQCAQLELAYYAEMLTTRLADNKLTQIQTSEKKNGKFRTFETSAEVTVKIVVN